MEILSILGHLHVNVRKFDKKKLNMNGMKHISVQIYGAGARTLIMLYMQDYFHLMPLLPYKCVFPDVDSR